MSALENASWPLALARLGNNQKQFNPFGYPEGISARDLAPPEMRDMVNEHFDKFPPPDPRVHYVIGTLYIFFGLMSASGNYYVLKIFGKYKHLRTPSNLLVMNLAFCDLMLFAGLYPELLSNIFIGGGRWIFGPLACQIHAWFGTTMGFAQLFTLQVISYDRYLVICKGVAAAPPSYKRSFWLLFTVWFQSLFWGISPLCGLGRFTLDGILTSCSYDYITPNMSVYLYNGLSWFLGYVVPLGHIIYSYFFIVKAVIDHENQLREQAKKMNVRSLRSSETDDKGRSAELKVAKVALISICCWIFAWTPFAVMTFLGLFYPMRVTPLMSSLPVIIAKSSAVYNPLIYALTHPKYQECLKKELAWLCAASASEKKSAAGADSVSTTTGTESAR